MSSNQSFGEQLSQSTMGANPVGNIKESIGSAVQDFSSKSVGDSSTDFLQSNSLIAKFVFLILILIVFMILMNLGIYLISYFLLPTRNPYVVKGVIEGSKKMTITQDPKLGKSVTVYRSKNEDKGAEFTWTCWLKVDSLQVGTAAQFQHIFSKGGNIPSESTAKFGVNGPGVYLKSVSDGSGEGTIQILMDSTDGSTQTVNIDGIPINRWFNIGIRLQNKILDVYMNGAIAKRVAFSYLPKQNYGDIYVCQNKGFTGSLSDLRYFDSALNVFDLTNIAMAGPNLTRAEPPLDDNTFDYLSTDWYN